MSIEAYQAVWSYRGNGFKTNLRCTLLALAEFASKHNGYTCSASIATIAEMLDTETRQAQRNLADLESLGLITIRQNCGRGNTNIYDLSPIMALKGVMRDTFLGKENLSSMTPISEEKVSSRTQKVSSRTVKGVMRDTLTVFNHINQEEEESGDDSVSEIEKHFTQTTGIMPTRSNWQSDWKMPIELWLKTDDVATIKDKITQAWAVATSKGFRISSPRSLNNTMVNLKADRANGKQNGFVQTWQSLQGLMSSYGADNKPELAPEVEGLVRKMGGWSTLCRMDLFEAQNKMRSLYNGT